MPKANFTARLEAGNVIVTEFPQPAAAGFIYAHITALEELYRNLPQAAVEITPDAGVSKSSQSSVEIEYR